MADNITAPAAGTVLATDDISGVHYPRAKIAWGVEGSAVDASATNPLPVTFTVTPLPTGAATEATITALSAKLPASLGAKAMSGSLSITPATSAEFAITAAALPLPAGAATSAKQDESAALLAQLLPSAAPFAITPHASDPLARETDAIAIKTAGTLVFRYPGAGADTTLDLPAGMFPIKATHVRATSTATGISGF